MNTPRLPGHEGLNIPALSGLFRTRRNSYKYLFFLALLDSVREADVDVTLEVDLDELAVGMLVVAWYPHTYFKLSFGPQDKIGNTLKQLERAGLPGPKRLGFGQSAGKKLRTHLHTVYESENVTEVRNLLRYVPYRLLTSFFRSELARLPDQHKNDRVARLALEFFDDARPLYCISADQQKLAVHADWVKYLQANHSIVHAWASWEWLCYMQSMNKSVPGIAYKLFPPEERESLQRQRKFWQAILEKAGRDILCPYSQKPLGTFHLDHYLPWTFVVHNQLWNLVPAAPEANESKGNSLPHDDYFERFVTMQHEALLISRELFSAKKWTALVEPFLVDLLPRGKPDELLSFGRLSDAYREHYTPLLAIAKNSGFPANWRYA